MRNVSYYLMLVTYLLLSGCATSSLNSNSQVSDEYNMQRYLAEKEAADKAYRDADYKKSLYLYMEITKYIKNDATIEFRKANTYARLEQPEQAIKAYQKTLLLEPSLSKAWYNMGLLQLKVSANTWIQMLVEIPPDDPLYDQVAQLSKGILEIIDGKKP